MLNHAITVRDLLICGGIGLGIVAGIIAICVLLNLAADEHRD